MTAPLSGDDAAAPPALVRHMNAATLWNLPDWSEAPAGEARQLEALHEDGVAAIQHPFPQMLPASPLAVAGMGRVVRPEGPREESDRWRQAAILKEIAEACVDAVGHARC